ncbi:glutathione peroxidase [Paenibacillus sp. 1P07SE]|uniref:glutathione peroxidase n=1 Tax=Paenibacillus sp. 1P07SE TaxID=3132209 RepID=UPI0039A71519
MTIYDYNVSTIRGEDRPLADYRGDVLLIVNTATKCGFAPQFSGLQQLHEQYEAQGLRVLGFPSNQFANQEPGENADIEQSCQINHGVTFPLFAKIDVNGPAAHPLYQHLVQEAPGILGSKAIKWNFTKFLVDRSGRVVKRFGPQDTPAKIEPHIKQLL